jgi:cysteinyl-tRNA synthetase
MTGAAEPGGGAGAPEVPEDVRRLADERAEARSRRDWARADAIRDELRAAGWLVAETPEGTVLRPAPPERRSDPSSLPPRWDQPDRHAASVVMHVTGWPADAARAVDALAAHCAGVDHEILIVADGCSPADLDALGALAGGPRAVLRVEPAAGFGAAMNLAMAQATGRAVVWLDPHVEATGDLLTPLLEALAAVDVGLAGGWGVVTTDLRQFTTAPGGEVDAVEGYLLAVRRADAARVRVDPGFRWYRNADLDYSFAVRDLGRRAVLVDVPAARHRHRGWHETAPDERERLSRRNFRRFLDHWRDRADLLTRGGDGGTGGAPADPQA